jgi:hypothetical protein
MGKGPSEETTLGKLLSKYPIYGIEPYEPIPHHSILILSPIYAGVLHVVFFLRVFPTNIWIHLSFLLCVLYYPLTTFFVLSTCCI